MLTLCLIKRLCAGSLMLFAAFVTLTALVDSPTARADPRGELTSRISAAELSDVAIVDFDFTPAVITITAGSTVRWTNTGSFIHTSTSDTSVWDSGDSARAVCSLGPSLRLAVILIIVCITFRCRAPSSCLEPPCR